MKRIYTLVFVSLLLICTSCFEYSERLVLNKDGSGYLEVEYRGYSDEEIDIDGKKFRFSDDEDEMRDHIERYFTSTRVKLDRLRSRERNGKNYVFFTVKFEDVEDLNRTRFFRKNGRIRADFSRNDIEFTREFNIDDDLDIDESENWFEAMVKSAVKETVLEEIKFEFEVEFPYNIRKSNARNTRSGNIARWRYTLVDLHEKGDARMKVTAGN